MQPTARGGSPDTTAVDKLTPAKQAMKAFIDQLGEGDVAAVYAFDDEYKEVVGPTTDMNMVRQGIEGFKLRWENKHAQQTHLYEGVREALKTARANNIRNVVVLSDGRDETGEKILDVNAYKQGNEKAINDEAAREPQIHIFTIAVGDENGVGNAYVDRQSLSAFSDKSSAASRPYISIPVLEARAKGADGKIDEGRMSGLLAEILNATFDEIFQRLHPDYELTIRPPAGVKQDDAEHFITIACAKCGETEPHTLAYTWPRGGTFAIQQVRSRPQWHLTQVPTPDTKNYEFSLAKIYLSLLFVLAGLGLAPVTTRKLSERNAARQVWSAIVEVKDGSPFVNRECPNECDDLSGEDRIKPGDVIVICPNPECRTAHHMDCWHLSADHCWRRVCKRHMPIPEHLLKRYGFAESDGDAPA